MYEIADIYDEMYVAGDEVPGYAGYGELMPQGDQGQAPVYAPTHDPVMQYGHVMGATEPYIYRVVFTDDKKVASNYVVNIYYPKYKRRIYIGDPNLTKLKSFLKNYKFKTFPFTRQQLQIYFTKASKGRVKLTAFKQVSPAPKARSKPKPVSKPASRPTSSSQQCPRAIIIVATALIALVSYIII